MPFLVSFGCNIGGVTGTRVIDSWGQRILTIALSWVVPCASTWGVVGLISGTLFGGKSVFVILARKAFITAEDLSALPLIMPRRMNVQSELASWFGDYYEKLNVVFTSNLNTNGAILVSDGLAYSLVIEGAGFWDHTKVTYRPLSPALTATSVLAWKQGQPFSLAATKFIQHMKCSLGMDRYKNQVFDIWRIMFYDVSVVGKQSFPAALTFFLFSHVVIAVKIFDFGMEAADDTERGE